MEGLIQHFSSASPLHLKELLLSVWECHKEHILRSYRRACHAGSVSRRFRG
jgi:hypothetical protein